MEQNIIDLSYIDLLLGISLVIISIGLSKWKEFGLEKDLMIATIRTFLQLLGVGFLLKYIFELNDPILIFSFILIMCFIAITTVVRGSKKISADLSFIVTISIISSSGITVFIITQIIINIEPWFNPQYLIPLSGMVLGNCINGASLALDRFDSDIKEKKYDIEVLLALGATSYQACSRFVKSAMRASLLPTINSMMVVGIVSFPGIMTGQILSGISPATAVKYQIIIMYMIAFSVTLCSFILIRLRLNSHFTKDHQFKNIS